MNIPSRNLKMLREMNDFTQEQMASFLHINRSSYANYESGVREVPLSVLERASSLLGVDLSVFFEEDVELANNLLTCAFRSDDLTDADLMEIAAFKNLVMNYLKINRLFQEING